MSYQASEWAVAQRTGSPTAKAVLLVLAEAAAAETAETYLSHATIAERAELSERAVWAAVKALADLGLIQRERRVDARGHRTSDTIRLRLPQPAPDAARDLSLTAPRASRNAVQPAPDAARCAEIDGPNRTSCTTLPARRAEEPVSMNQSDSLSERGPTKRAKPRLGLPDGFPDLDAEGYGASEFKRAGLTFDFGTEAQRFRDHHLAKGTLSADWRASWRTWVCNGISYAQDRRDRQTTPRAPQRLGSLQDPLEIAKRNIRGS